MLGLDYHRTNGYLWLPKRVRVGEPGWARLVVKAATCPQQRVYRRLTRAERTLYEKQKQPDTLP